MTALASRFWSEELEDDVFFSLQPCGPLQPRPVGEALHDEKPYVLLHWDFLYMSPGASVDKYLLVVKDDASHFVMLFPCANAIAEATFDCLLEWFATFGLVKTWVTDQGTLFKNVVTKQLQHALGAHHHFTASRSPWAN
ncbi:hypothetical protein PsorP6_013623 [Peronosclerospora sorghi]|uniref:Uncharacterized protein n=1 Tax=Peronosclerospora sorghi TaxID=230839 RepID=A0ACC0VG55_9STRA|nr:hypothetical protein PsorP6_013623 [Peronosclerospora sorghi]